MTETSSPVVVEERLQKPMVFKESALHFTPERNLAAARPAGGSVLLKAAVTIPLLALAILLIATGLMPAVFVALVAFAPALAPLILVGLGVLATAELKTPGGDRLCDPNQPCCCGRH